MPKLCKRGKDSAKRKYKVYPSAYANLYASKVCKGKAFDYKGKIYPDKTYISQVLNKRSKIGAHDCVVRGV